MVFLSDIDQVRAVQFGAKYLWDIKIPSAPAPFDKWFPAVDVEEPLAYLDSYTFDSQQSTHKVPLRSQAMDLRITFHDDENHSLLHWLEDWINTLSLNNGQWTSTVFETARLVQMLKLNSRREIVKETSYWVYPEGQIQFEGSSSSEPTMYSVVFPIVGRR